MAHPLPISSVAGVVRLRADGVHMVCFVFFSTPAAVDPCPLPDSVRMQLRASRVGRVSVFSLVLSMEFGAEMIALDGPPWCLSLAALFVTSCSVSGWQALQPMPPVLHPYHVPLWPWLFLRRSVP